MVMDESHEHAMRSMRGVSYSKLFAHHLAERDAKRARTAPFRASCPCGARS